MKRLIKTSVLLALILGSISFTYGQNPKKAARQKAIKNMVDSTHFYFNANYVLPQHGVSRQLTSVYNLKVTKDSIISYLPFFGEAHMAPDPGSTEGGIVFTSTNFGYNVTQNKKGGWEITIKFKDHNITNWRDVQQMVLNISPDGYASLFVLNSNRDPISFQGDIVAKE